MLNAVSVLTINGQSNGSVDFTNNVRIWHKLFVAILPV